MSLFEGLIRTIEGIIESIYGVFKAAFDVVYAFAAGIVHLVWSTLETFATFIGVSVHFVLSNIVVLLLLFIGLAVYRNNTTTINRGQKKTV